MSPLIPRSAMPDIVWPAIATTASARQLALQYQYRRSEHWPPDRMRAHQFAQLRHLLAHADRTMPFWRTRLRAAGIQPGVELTPAIWSRIPILARADAQDAGAALHCLSPPPSHGEVVASFTSGSSGRPLRVMGTDTHQTYWRSFLLREMLWHRIDFQAKMATIRTLRLATFRPGQGVREPGWGDGMGEIFFTGPALAYDILRPIAEQADWLLREDPTYLQSHSTNFPILAQHFRNSSRRPASLRNLRGFAEIVTDDARALCRDVFGLEILDTYTAEEVGYIGLQCPDFSPNLHVMSEGVYLEILNDVDQPCGPGEVGRVVVTPMHNFAMPLIRYELGDLAECGAPCPCGRGLPVITRVLGRSRDAVVMTDGTRRAAFFGSKRFYKISPIRQFQARQTRPGAVEICLVVRRPLTAAEEALVIDLVRGDLAPDFGVALVYVDALPRGASGKYEEFRCDIT